MKLFRNIFSPFGSSNRFDRYYGNLVRSGEGYPTADEAKRDLRYQDVNKALIGWMR